MLVVPGVRVSDVALVYAVPRPIQGLRAGQTSPPRVVIVAVDHMDLDVVVAVDGLPGQDVELRYGVEDRILRATSVGLLDVVVERHRDPCSALVPVEVPP